MTTGVREIGDAPFMLRFVLKDTEVADGVVIRVATAQSRCAPNAISTLRSNDH